MRMRCMEGNPRWWRGELGGRPLWPGDEATKMESTELAVSSMANGTRRAELGRLLEVMAWKHTENKRER